MEAAFEEDGIHRPESLSLEKLSDADTHANDDTPGVYSAVGIIIAVNTTINEDGIAEVAPEGENVGPSNAHNRHIRVHDTTKHPVSDFLELSITVEHRVTVDKEHEVSKFATVVPENDRDCEHHIRSLEGLHVRIKTCTTTDEVHETNRKTLEHEEHNESAD